MTQDIATLRGDQIEPITAVEDTLTKYTAWDRVDDEVNQSFVKTSVGSLLIGAAIPFASAGNHLVAAGLAAAGLAFDQAGISEFNDAKHILQEISYSPKDLHIKSAWDAARGNFNIAQVSRYVAGPAIGLFAAEVMKQNYNFTLDVSFFLTAAATVAASIGIEVCAHSNLKDVPFRPELETAPVRGHEDTQPP